LKSTIVSGLQIQIFKRAGNKPHHKKPPVNSTGGAKVGERSG
jgi:hypothetical protein